VFESADGLLRPHRQPHAGRCVNRERLFAKHADQTMVVRIGILDAPAGPVRGTLRIPRPVNTVNTVPKRTRPCPRSCPDVNQLAVLCADRMLYQEQVRDAEELTASSDQRERESCTM
jgi:hypothetical protein